MKSQIWIPPTLNSMDILTPDRIKGETDLVRLLEIRYFFEEIVIEKRQGIARWRKKEATALWHHDHANDRHAKAIWKKRADRIHREIRWLSKHSKDAEACLIAALAQSIRIRALKDVQPACLRRPR